MKYNVGDFVLPKYARHYKEAGRVIGYRRKRVILDVPDVGEFDVKESEVELATVTFAGWAVVP
jgi:hypothetical protein